MPLSVTGLSHHNSPVELRERMAFEPTQLEQPLLHLHKRTGGGVAIVSTCNRVEVYVSGAVDAQTAERETTVFLAAWHDLAPEDFARYLYTLTEEEAVAHLFRVASSLDSMVVGEAQILGQVQQAFLAAQAAGTTDKIINAAFQTAFKIAKQVRTETEIGLGKVSVASVAVGLAVHIFGDLDDKTVLVVGSGETGKTTLQSLVNHGATRVLVANRTLERAEELAAQFNGQALDMGGLYGRLHEADIVITSTASKEPVLLTEHFQVALKRRNYDPIFAIDIAVPRDIHPAVRDLDNVYLYDIDDLQEVTNQNLEARRAQLVACQALVERQVRRFMAWHRGLKAEPTIVSMRKEVEAIRERELEKTLAHLPNLDDKTREEIEYLTRRIVNNILQRPLRTIKEEVADDEAGSVLTLVKRLFGVKDREELL